MWQVPLQGAGRHQPAFCFTSRVRPGGLLGCPVLPFPALSSGVMRTLLLGAVLMSHVKHGAGALSGVHCYRALAGWGPLDYGVRLFLVHNWPQGRGGPAEGPCGAPEAGREEASRVAATFPRRKDSMVHVLMAPGPSRGPGSGIPFCAEESLGRVWSCAAQCGRWLPTGAGRGPWLRTSASGLSLGASFLFLLCARSCPRCGGYCLGV